MSVCIVAKDRKKEPQKNRHTIARDLTALIVHTQAITTIVAEKTSQNAFIQEVLVFIKRTASVDLTVAAE